MPQYRVGPCQAEVWVWVEAECAKDALQEAEDLLEVWAEAGEHSIVANLVAGEVVRRDRFTKRHVPSKDGD